MTSISLCMIVKNEEKQLERCLTSVRDVVDEIVIVDTGSDDKTLEIADSFNANIHHFKWNNDFSSARNFALSKCQSDWILYLDADEELNSNSVNELITIINGKLAAVNCVVKSLTSNDAKFGVMKYPRLFPNDPRIKFEGKVHEQIQTSLNNHKITLIDSTIEIIHYGYILNDETATKKLERNLALLQSSKKNNSYDKLKLAQTLHSLKRYEESEKHFKDIINDRSTELKIKSIALIHFAILLYEKNDFKTSLEVALKGFNISPGNAYLNYLISSIYLKLDDKPKAFQFIQSALDLNIKLINSSKISESEISLDQSDLYFKAINLAKTLSDSEKLSALINGLSDFAAKELNVDSSLFAQNLLSMIQEKDLSEQKINIIISIINESNLNSFVDLLKNFNNAALKKQIFLQLDSKFQNSIVIKKNLAGIYLDSNTDKAEKLFQECLNIEDDSSIYINLISLYIGKKDFEKVRSTFNQLTSRFSDKPLIKQKIDILSQKLNPILTAN
jgi:glycosyltransferase involved in cell wall biosynthesis